VQQIGQPLPKYMSFLRSDFLSQADDERWAELGSNLRIGECQVECYLSFMERTAGLTLQKVRFQLRLLFASQKAIYIFKDQLRCGLARHC